MEEVVISVHVLLHICAKGFGGSGMVHSSLHESDLNELHLIRLIYITIISPFV